MNIVYIHGNGATADSFNFIRSQLKAESFHLLEYSSADGFQSNLQAMLNEVRGLSEIFFIGHSLGGLYALHLSHHLRGQVRGAVTLSTPYGGSEAATLLKFLLPFNQLLKDIHPASKAVIEGKAIDVPQPWINVVTTKGHSELIPEPNDGVVTFDSMRARSEEMTLIDIDSNHYEIVLSYKAVGIIKAAIAVAQAHDALSDMQTA